MQGIEFETDQTSRVASTSHYVTPKKESMMVRLLAKVGIEDTITANFVLLGIVGLMFGITIFLYAGILGESKIDRAAEARAIQLMQNRR